LPTGKKRLTCAVACLKAWLQVRGHHPGPVFIPLGPGGDPRSGLSGTAIWKIVKRVARNAGIDPKRISPHSFRAGFITEAGEAGVSHLIIAKQSGHRSMESLKKYFRPTDVFRANACNSIDL
jgi:integrase